MSRKLLKSKPVRLFDAAAERFNAWAGRHGIPIHICPFGLWYVMAKAGPFGRPFSWWGRFHKRVKDSYNPRRWGGHFLGLEIGCRG